MTLDEARALVGRKVAYVARQTRPSLIEWDAEHPSQGTMFFTPAEVEAGVITSVNDHYVFVRYGAEWQSKATSPEDLVLVP